jgi:hypothetical protein
VRIWLSRAPHNSLRLAKLLLAVVSLLVLSVWDLVAAVKRCADHRRDTWQWLECCFRWPESVSVEIGLASCLITSRSYRGGLA